jgi:hypothetical protein
VEHSVFPLKKATEFMGEEQEKKPTVERIADGLRTSARAMILVFILSLLIFASVYVERGERGGGLEEFFFFDFPLMVCGFVVLAWFFCHAARYILVDVTSDMRKEKPNVVGRIGQVTYWLGCAVGILSIPVSACVWIVGVDAHKIDAELLVVILGCLAIGAAVWLIGRAARYILKGD